MTATPIPRTLTLTYYGEMDVSRLDEMPPGRQPIQTVVMSSGRLDEVVEALARHVEGGGQAYWVCPLVEESENSDLAAAEARAETLRTRFGERVAIRSEEHTSELQSLIRISSAVFGLKKKNNKTIITPSPLKNT